MVGDVPVVTAPADIDITTAAQLRAMLGEPAACGNATIVVDLSGTRFCDSAGLTVLVRAHKQAQALGGGLRLVLPDHCAVARIFTITGLDGVIPHFASLPEALPQAPPATAPRARLRHVPVMRGGAERGRAERSPGPGV
jgi:anti-anti-sigma factor